MASDDGDDWEGYESVQMFPGCDCPAEWEHA